LNQDALFLADIVKACDKIARYIEPGEEAFMDDELIQDGVIRNLEIIGEATKQLSTDAKAKAPDEPWRLISGMRHKLLHHDFGVNLCIVGKPRPPSSRSSERPS